MDQANPPQDNVQPQPQPPQPPGGQVPAAPAAITTFVHQRVEGAPRWSHATTWGNYKKQIELWKRGCKAAKSDMGRMVIEALDDCKLKVGLKAKVFDHLEVDDIFAEDGLKKVLDFLEEELGEDSIYAMDKAWKDIITFKRTNQEIGEFVSQFNTKWKHAANAGVGQISDKVKGLQLMHAANCSREQKNNIMSHCEGLKTENDNRFYKQVEKQVKNQLGGSLPDNSTSTKTQLIQMTHDEVDGQVLLTEGGQRVRIAGKGRGTFGGRDRFTKGPNEKNTINPRTGEVNTCHNCKSEYHFANNCDESGPRGRRPIKKRRKEGALVGEGEEEEEKRRSLSDSEQQMMSRSFLEQSFFCEEIMNCDETKKLGAEGLSRFTTEAMGAGALDSGCTSSVCGKRWINNQRRVLNNEGIKITKAPYSFKTFKFGAGDPLKSLATLTLPAWFGNSKVKMRIDVVDTDIPLLISKKTMKSAKMRVDYDKNIVEWGPNREVLNTFEVSAGHTCFNLSPPNTRITDENREVKEEKEEEVKEEEEEEVKEKEKREVTLYVTNIEQVFEVRDLLQRKMAEATDNKGRMKVLAKLHQQLGHAKRDKLVPLLHEAEVEEEGDGEIIDKIQDACKGCLVRNQAAAKPATSLPVASTFNEKLGLDLKIFGTGQNQTEEEIAARGIVLHMVCLFSKYHLATYIDDKTPASVVIAILENWVKFFGIPNAVWHDNGGEFIGKDMKELSAFLNIRQITTGARHPHGNGITERHHKFLDEMLLNLLRDYPQIDRNTLLGWACAIKNSMIMNKGYSPAQLVFGKNPSLPNIIEATPRACQNLTTSEALANVLNLIHSAREGFTKTDASERLHKAFMAKRNPSEEVFEQGDQVHYWQDGRWEGPAKIFYYDHKVVWIRHGSQIVKAWANNVTARNVKDNYREVGRNLWNLKTENSIENKEKEKEREKEEKEDEKKRKERKEEKDEIEEMGIRAVIERLNEKRELERNNNDNQIENQNNDNNDNDNNDNDRNDRYDGNIENLGNDFAQFLNNNFEIDLNENVDVQPEDEDPMNEEQQDEGLEIQNDIDNNERPEVEVLRRKSTRFEKNKDEGPKKVEVVSYRPAPEKPRRPFIKDGKTILGNEKYKNDNGQEYVACDFCELHTNIKSIGSHIRSQHWEQYKNAEDHALIVDTKNEKREKNEKPLIKLEPGELIEIEVEGKWIEFTVISRMEAPWNNHFFLENNEADILRTNLEKKKWRQVKRTSTMSKHLELILMNIIPRDQHNTKEVREAKQVEIQKLIDWKTYTLVPDSGQFRVSTTWVVWKKREGENSIVRARLVARGYEEQNNLAKDSPTVDKTSVRIAVCIATGMGWPLFSHDVRSAFLQGEELERTVFLQPPKEMKNVKGKLMRLRTCIYGLNDASLQWYRKLKKEILKLNCVESKLDPAVFYKMTPDNKIDGVLAVHVDDLITTGSVTFEKEVIIPIKNVFAMGKSQSQSFTYVGLEMEQTKKGVTITQKRFIDEKIKEIMIDSEKKKDSDRPLNKEENTLLRQTAGKIGWIASGVRPDLSFPRVEISTHFNDAKMKDLKYAAKILRQIKGHKNQHFIPATISLPKMWRLEVYTDGSLANLDFVKSTRGAVILLKGPSNSATPIFWTSNCIQKVCTSALSAEVIAAEKGMSEAIYVKSLIEELTGLEEGSINLDFITDSRSLYDNLISNKAMDDKKIRLSLAAIKQYVESKEVNRAVWVESKLQLADILTKKGGNSDRLLEIMEEGKF